MTEPRSERSPTKVAWACLEAHRAQDWDRLRTLLHPNARIGTFAGGGRPEDPEAAIVRLREMHEDFLYQANVANMIELDAEAVVLEGRVQYRRNEGWADTEQTWLYVIRQGLLYRSAVYRSSHHARAEYEMLGPTLGIPDEAPATL